MSTANTSACSEADQRLESSVARFQTVARFQKLLRIGQGTFGVVYLARDRQTGEHVALKRLTDPEGEDAIKLGSREQLLLEELHHPNIVRLKHVVQTDSERCFLVFEYCEHDLYKLLRSQRYPYREAEVKCIVKQILEGLQFLHAKNIMHRDVKTENILMNKLGSVKLCDFNSMKQIGSSKSQAPKHTPNVTTAYSSAPEVLLGAASYTEKCDMWGVGCVMAEVIKGTLLFDQTTELGVISCWAEVLGSPHLAWPGFGDLPGAKIIKPFKQTENTLFRDFIEISEAGRHLLSLLLTYNPELRISAEQALRHDWFREQPLPEEPANLPQMPSTLEAAAKARNEGLETIRNSLKHLQKHDSSDGLERSRKVQRKETSSFL